MNAASLLGRIAAALSRVKFEVVMIGNAAAALQGSPVTTIDIDFMFRASPQNLRKLKALADLLDATIYRPYYPVSKLYRMVGRKGDLQLDFMPQIHGVKSFASLRSRAHEVLFGGQVLLVADLSDIIKSKRAANRAQDRAVLKLLVETLEEKKKSQKED